MAEGESVPFAELAGVGPGEEREPLGPAREAELELRAVGGGGGGGGVRRSAGPLQTVSPPAEGLRGAASDSPFLS